MSKESVAQYLKSNTPEDLHTAIDSLIKQRVVEPVLQNKENARLVNKVLSVVKVCDPAIGSGAFPMGVLYALFDCRHLLYGFMGKNEDFSYAKVKRDIIQNNIYGVDIEKGAVDIARLRFWLALVVDENEPQPLPNLDFKIMQGNSLLEQYEDIDLSRLSDAGWNMKVVMPQADLFGHIDDPQLKLTFSSETHTLDLQKKITRYFSIDDHEEKARLFRDIEEDVRQNILYNIDMRQRQAERMVEELKTYPSLNKKQIKEKTIKEEAIIRYKEMMNDVQTMSFPNDKFFLWHTYFKNVFDQGGFDIIIGNPPYIQLQNNSGELARKYDNCNYNTLTPTGDIYCLFYERGWQLLKRGGHLCYITSNKWMRAGYGEKTREFFANKTNPILLIDFAGVKIFESATVDTNILLFSKSENQHQTVCAVTNKDNKDSVKNLSDFVRQQHSVCEFCSSDSWVILSPIEQSIKRKIEAVGTPLKDWNINIYRGVLTGYNEAFIINTEKRDEILANCLSDEERHKTAELIRPILRGKDIKRYGYVDNGLYLINTHNGVKGKFPRINIDDYPTIKAHLDQYLDKISIRADKGDTPYNLRNCAYLEDFSKQQIVWIELSDEPKFALAENVTSVNTVFFMTGKHILHLLGLLNSKLITWYFRHCIGTTSGVGTNRWLKYTIEQIPMAPYNTELGNMASEISKHYNTAMNNRIDHLVCNLYSLTAVETEFILNQ